MKLLSGVLALACVPAAFAANNAPLPKDNVAEFVAERLDVTTLPASIRPKSQKSKKTFADYGYVVCRAGPAARRCKSSTQPDGGEGLAMTQGLSPQGRSEGSV